MFRKSLIAVLVVLCSFNSGLAQLTASDSLFLVQLKISCELNTFQSATADTIVTSTAIQLKQLDKELSKVSRSTLSEDEKVSRQNEIRKQKKEALEGRDMAIGFILDDRQRKIFLEQVKPTKPAVLHMGMNHDRANCNVCVAK